MPGSKIHFASNITAGLFIWEFAGQISDGKYENAKPSNHWKWVINSKYIIDGKEYYVGNLHSKKYSFREWIKGIEGKDKKYDWTIRCLYYARGAQLYTQAELNEKNIDYDGSVIEALGRFVEKNPDGTWEDFLKDNGSYGYMKTAIENAVKAKDATFMDEYKKVADKIKKSDMAGYIKSCCKSINTDSLDVKESAEAPKMIGLVDYIIKESINSKQKELMKAVVVQVEQLWENGFKDKSEARKYFQKFLDGKDHDGELMEQLIHMLDADGEFSYDECYDEADFIESVLKDQVKYWLEQKD